MNDFVLQVLTIMSEYDDHESLYWRCDGEYAPVSFFINCNDLFCWATADAEQIKPENLHVLTKAYADANAIDCGTFGGSLFACRVRKMRPQRPSYRDFPEEMWPLFDACGPPRDPKSEG